MKYLSFTYQISLLDGAYKRLKEWFDPSVEGSPYEAKFEHQQPQTGKRSLLLKKRLLIRL